MFAGHFTSCINKRKLPANFTPDKKNPLHQAAGFFFQQHYFDNLSNTFSKA